MLRLFLENYEIELNEKIQFALTKQFEDIVSPADIINDYSKTVKIPFSNRNNRIFGMLFSTDRVIVDGTPDLVGVHFNPYKKIDFRLQWGDSVVMVGYAKNISIDKDYYSITLNGELGKVFQEMRKITFDTTAEDKTYLIDGAKYVSEKINKELIADMWTNEVALSLDLIEKGEEGYDVKQYINFAPNNSFVDDFNYKTYQYNQQESEEFKQELEDKVKYKFGEDVTYESIVGISAQDTIDKGLYPREIGEYRSYHQLPYIYFNKLFQILLEKTKQITGYNYLLDEDWFNTENPYWGKLVYMLKRLFSDKPNDDKKEVEEITLRLVALAKVGGGYKELSFSNLTDSNREVVTFPTETAIYTLSWLVPIKIKYPNANVSGHLYNLREDAGIEIHFRVLDKNNNVYHTTKYLIRRKDSGYEGNGGYNMILDLESQEGTIFTIPNVAFAQSVTCGSKIQYGWRFIGNDGGGAMFVEDLNTGAFVGGGTVKLAIGEPIEEDKNLTGIGNDYSDVKTTKEMQYDVIHTNQPFTLNDLWNNEYNLFDEILDYCKIYRIGIFCDSVTKTIKFIPLKKYFRDYKILNWTDKVDYNRSYSIQPITFQNKYLLFNYKGVDTSLNDGYKEKFGVNYGEYKLTTQYEFNTETKELFKGINNSICNTDYIKSWKSIYDSFSIVYSVPKEITVYNKTKEGKNVDLFGCMFIYDGLCSFDTSDFMRKVKISDDSTLNEITRNYFYSCYTLPSENNAILHNGIEVYKYPYLNVKTDNCNNITLFQTPAESYIYIGNDNYFSNTRGIYYNFWENYLNERYNINNKIVTCYIYLTQQDFEEFEYRNFVKIGNQLYMVNKIYDYALDENIPTKCDLITIQDIKGYTDNNFKHFNLYFKDDDGVFREWNSEEDYVNLRFGNFNLYVSSFSEVYWEDLDGGLQGVGVSYYHDNDWSSVTGGNGTIPSGIMTQVTLSIENQFTGSGTMRLTNGIKTYDVSIVYN